jgi:integrase
MRAKRGFISKGLLKRMINLAIGKHIDGIKRAPLVMWREAWRELVCFTTCARFSDLNRVRRSDVFVDGNSIRIVFNVRKTDPYHKKHTAFLFENNTRYCPVRITKMYLELLPREPSGYMLPDLSKKAAFTMAASFSACRRLQKSLMRQLDVDPEPFGLHSARVGGTKYLENADMSDPDIAYVIGWAEGSVQPKNYAKTAMAKYLKAARKLVLFSG